ncbi:hypothetical protein NA57DRAFT_71323 [Rhizodiscina lignyota]|uniref:SnoaL-like domain-containing protein n=1 Tax=Rhizodiscina lignyota TaxID=1504668 RepID=A0A9P4IP85_9PEZI|nr:hypothetical protein NA57DRAFT_71323 [Rhizodiscina lignyota]
MATAKEDPKNKLNALYQLIQKMTPSSPPEDFDTFAAFFSPDCKVFLRSMREHKRPGIGHSGAISMLKEMLECWSLNERRVLSTCSTSDGELATVFFETSKRLTIVGDVIDPFYETEVAVFNAEGLITDLRIYSCWSHIVSIIQDKTGSGPYNNPKEARAMLEDQAVDA